MPVCIALVRRAVDTQLTDISRRPSTGGCFGAAYVNITTTPASSSSPASFVSRLVFHSHLVSASVHQARTARRKKKKVNSTPQSPPTFSHGTCEAAATGARDLIAISLHQRVLGQ